jgi:geranylgeranyl pyrophosphate synthase
VEEAHTKRLVFLEPVNTNIIDADECYCSAVQKAADYFESLHQQIIHKTYVQTLIKDIQSWEHSHIHHYSLLTRCFGRNKKPDSRDHGRYIQWLYYADKLDDYLDRSISYIFMRDLGKALDSPDTQTRIRRAVDILKDYLTRLAVSDRAEEAETIGMAWLYRKAQKEGIESSMIWVMDKLKAMSKHIPKGMDAEHAQRKLIKIIVGVLMHEIEEMDSAISLEERSRRLDRAIRLGYSYGLTYPFIDDMLDADVLSPEEKNRYSDLIRTALITGSVPDLAEWTGKNSDLARYIHSELRDAFDYIKSNQQSETLQLFFEQAYVFFNSQEMDRMKDLSNPNYTNEDLYIPIILKSSSSRLIARSVTSAPENSGFDNRTFFYGIYNQLADDFTDMFDDMKKGAVTPYTYYMKYHDQRPDLINPFELYWTVISSLIHNVYHSDPKTCEVMLDRAINGLKRFKERMGTEKYDEVMSLFASSNPKFNNIIQKMVRQADDVDFFDKLLRDWLLNVLKNEKAEKEAFENTMKTVGKEINGILNIPKTWNDPLLNQTIVDAANYSLEAGGKRVRPLMTWVMGVNGYGLDPKAMAPLLRSLEYVHTASLIFDDLPSQDNADTRRGCLTLHAVYNCAIAELTGLFLTQKAVEEQASLDQYDPKTVLNLIRYAAGVAGDMCKGQAMDLESRGKQLTLEQLNTMCFHKTGLAFQASLVMPAILAHVKEPEIKALKKLAFHAGIAFQIKDDLLDAEGHPAFLGKLTGKDTENNNSTFVTTLGPEGARKEMWDHYCQAMEALADVPRNTAFLKQLLNYIVNRDH